MKTDIFQELYDSEINFSVTAFWDAGFVVLLGDSMNGYRSKATTFDTWQQVSNWLRSEAIKAYPDSEFAQKYRGLE